MTEFSIRCYKCGAMMKLVGIQTTYTTLHKNKNVRFYQCDCGHKQEVEVNNE